MKNSRLISVAIALAPLLLLLCPSEEPPRGPDRLDLDASPLSALRMTPTGEAPPPELAEGRLVDERGDPLAGYDVFLRVAHYAPRPFHTAPRGRELAVERPADDAPPPGVPGPRTAGDGTFPTSLSKRSGEAVELWFTRPGDAVRFHAGPLLPADLGTFVVPDLGDVRGRVVTPHGRPVAGADVWCVPMDTEDGGPFGASRESRQSVRGKTDAEGRYLLRGIPAGPVRVFAVCDEAGGAVDRVEVTHDAVAEAGDVYLDRYGAFVSGTVTRAGTGEPVGGCSVAAYPCGRHAETTADGEFRVGPLPPGEFHLLAVSTDGEVRRAGPFRVEAEEALTGLRIDLPVR